MGLNTDKTVNVFDINDVMCCRIVLRSVSNMWLGFKWVIMSWKNLHH